MAELTCPQVMAASEVVAAAASSSTAATTATATADCVRAMSTVSSLDTCVRLLVGLGTGLGVVTAGKWPEEIAMECCSLNRLAIADDRCSYVQFLAVGGMLDIPSPSSMDGSCHPSKLLGGGWALGYTLVHVEG